MSYMDGERAFEGEIVPDAIFVIMVCSGYVRLGLWGKEDGQKRIYGKGWELRSWGECMLWVNGGLGRA